MNERVFLRAMRVLLLLCSAGTFYSLHHLVVLFVWQHAHQSHHAHHSGAPILWQAVRLWFFHGVIHAHFHERILRESRHTVRILGDRRMMHMFERHAFGQRFHLRQRFGVGRVRRFDRAVL